MTNPEIIFHRFSHPTFLHIRNTACWCILFHGVALLLPFPIGGKNNAVVVTARSKRTCNVVPTCGPANCEAQVFSKCP